MMRDVDFAFLDYHVQPPIYEEEAEEAEEAGEEEAEEAEEAGEEGGGSEGGAAVLGRLWVSAPGTVSPLHYDLTDSYLCQVRGTKRLLLWPSKSLRALDPYPPDHALARRLRVGVTGDEPPAKLRRPWRWRARRAVGRPLEAVLRPGDVLYFPANWAHHTEALVVDDDEGEGGAAQPSFSLGFRTDGAYLL